MGYLAESSAPLVFRVGDFAVAAGCLTLRVAWCFAVVLCDPVAGVFVFPGFFAGLRFSGAPLRCAFGWVGDAVPLEAAAAFDGERC